jgi:hypothetical protein
MNWLCRLIGHRWITKRRYSVDGVTDEVTQIWACCVRCGERTPDVLVLQCAGCKDGSGEAE